jgi:hypothetical protein
MYLRKTSLLYLKQVKSILKNDEKITILSKVNEFINAIKLSMTKLWSGIEPQFMAFIESVKLACKWIKDRFSESDCCKILKFK